MKKEKEMSDTFILDVGQKSAIANEMKNNKKSNNRKKENHKRNPLIICLLIIISFTLGTISTYYYFEVIKKDYITIENNSKNETTKNKEQIEILEITDSQVIKLYNNISNAIGYYCDIDDYYKDEKVTVNNLSEDLALNIAIFQLYNDKKESGQGIKFYKGDSFTSEELNKKITEIFGKNFKYTNKDINSCPSFKYDNTTNKYIIEQEPACGGTCGPVNIIKVVKAIKSDNSIEIYVRVLFVDVDENSNIIYYKDYTKTQALTNLEKNDVTGAVKDSDKNLSQGGLYKLTFNKEESNYVFASSEPINQ